MDTYLALAERVLSREKRSLTALQILRIAYRDDMAPSHLRGQTQHKTLQARLSEDILRYRDDSKFYRTAPGKFFLTALRDHPSVPPEDREPMIARRRQRDLPQNRALAISKKTFNEALLPHSSKSKKDAFVRIVKDGNFHYTRNSRAASSDELIVWSFVIVVKKGQVLSYRAGPYREQRDNFKSKRVIGFYAPIVDSDLTLFDQKDHGIVWSGIKAIASDLDFHDENAWRALYENSCFEAVVFPDQGVSPNALLAMVSFVCPEWLEPTTSRLAINELEWLDVLRPINHHEDFDPWSLALLPEARRLAQRG